MHARSVLVVIVLLVLSCRTPAPGPATVVGPSPEPVAAPTAPIHFVQDPDLNGLRVRLSDADAPPDGPVRSSVVDSQPLTDAAADRLLSRLPDLPVDPAVEFALRSSSIPAPRPGVEVEVPFPPDPSDLLPPAVAPGPLRVLRHSPDGEVPVAGQLSVTFSEPMVAVTSHDEASAVRPVQLTPQPEVGAWRWIGTRTLLFDPGTARLPAATEYTVTVPAGTTSAAGKALAEAQTFTFATPAPRVVGWAPTGYAPTDLEPVVVVVFDQAIDRADLHAFVRLERGREELPTRFATPEEIAADPVAADLVARVPPDRWIALRPVAPLDRATRYGVVVRRSAPSAEGPRVTDADQDHTFSTYEPLAIVSHGCSYGERCPPDTSFHVEFNNTLDPASIDPRAFASAPVIGNFRAWPSGNWLYLDGIKEGRTPYAITLPAGVTDRFGQTLGTDQVRRFTTGPANKALQGPPGAMVVLDPAGEPTVSVYSTNHKKLRVRAFRVDPTHWDAAGTWESSYYDHEGKGGAPPGAPVMNTTLSVDDEDSLTESVIDLAPHLDADGHGQFLVWVEPTRQPRNRWERHHLLFWVQATDLGLTAAVGGEELLGWATSLQDGTGQADVELSIHPQGSVGSTGGDGLVALPLSPNPTGRQLLVARRGSDVALLPEATHWHQTHPGWKNWNAPNTFAWFTFDDRNLYKPGETVHVKGWVRRTDLTRGGGIGGMGAKPGTVEWTLWDPRGAELATGEAPLSETGGWDVVLELPDDANLGYARLEAFVSNREGHMNHSFQIQEFRRPEFEVLADADAGPHVLGGSATVELSAKYFAGGGLPDAETTWTATATPASFSPPGWGDWNFGAFIPWWRWNPSTSAASQMLGTHLGSTDGGGVHRLRVDFEAMNPPRPTTVTLNGAVMDLSRQSWAATETLLVHPADRYVGLRAERPFAHEGEPLRVDAVAVDLNGVADAGRAMTLTLTRQAWEAVDGRWQQVSKNPQICELISDNDGERCEWTPPEGGTYRVEATLEDGAGRRNASELTLWVAGGEGAPSRGVRQQEVTVIPSQREFQPGDVAELLLEAPFPDAEALLTVRRSGVVSTQRFRFAGTSHTVQVPILQEHLPDVTVQVDLVGETTRTDDDGNPLPDAVPRPAFAVGTIQLKVPPLSRALAVGVTPSEAVTEPGATASIALTLTDADGAPTAGEIAVVVVDEAILSLSGYSIPDPLATFYALRGPGTVDHHSRALLLLTDPLAVAASGGPSRGASNYRDDDDAEKDSMDSRSGDIIATAESTGVMAPPVPPGEARPKVARRERKSSADGSGGLNRQGGQAPPGIELRSDFSALAAFEPSIAVGPDGTASLEVALPDSLTQYRIIAVAVSGDTQFGRGESTITARKPLQVRPSLPRFLNFGDRAELPILVQNQTSTPMNVRIALRTSGMELTGPRGRKLVVPANERAEVRFPAEARAPGIGRYQVVVEGIPGREGGRALPYTDAASGELPIWTPATTEAFATYGTLDEGAIRQPVQAPAEVWPQFGGLEVTTSSTALQSLTDAFLYLVEYPFDCSEQMASRVIVVAALRDVLDAFETDGLPDEGALVAAVTRDLRKLEGRQRYNGGFGLWTRHDPHEQPYVSVHAMHAIAIAQAKGFDLPAGLLAPGVRYLRNIDSFIPRHYSTEARWTIRAYAISVLEALGETPGPAAKQLYAAAGTDLPLEAQGWLLPTLSRIGQDVSVAAIVRHLENRASETAEAANFVTSYGDSGYLLMHSDRRTDGVLLDALVRVQPEHDLIPKLVRGLLAHAKRGRWGGTQENGLILIALDRYFGVFEAEDPDFVARVWLGDGYAGDHAFVGRTTDQATMAIPMDRLARTAGAQDLTLQRDGDAGRLYYRVGLKYAPRSLEVEPADHGFEVTRRYEPVDDDGDVWRDEEGVWHVRAGARVRVRVTMAVDSRRYHVALVDPMPAGLEPINPELANVEALPADTAGADRTSGRWYWWWGPWYEHDNLRDERAEAFASLLGDGVHEYTYVARGTTPGTFVVPPPWAEEMYAPETFGRGASDRLVVESR